MNKNLEIWDKVKEVPKEAQKPINFGALKGYTDINPQWRMQAMTEQFGIVGIGWYYEVVNKWLEPSIDGSICCFVEIHLFIKHGKDWSKPIYGIGGNEYIQKTKNGLKSNDECFKMATTDALSVAMKAIGVGANIYMGLSESKHDDRFTQDKITTSQAKQLPTLKEGTQEFNKCVEGLKKGFTLSQIKSKYIVTNEIKIKLLEEATKNK